LSTSAFNFARSPKLMPFRSIIDVLKGDLFCAPLDMRSSAFLYLEIADLRSTTVKGFKWLKVLHSERG
jgi:hypothetical protein